MGQAAVPIQDIADAPADRKASADDLLSKLAGDEIEKLLTEAENPAPTAAPGVTPDAKPASTNPPPSAAAAPTAAPTNIAEPESSAEAAVQAELDTLFQQITSPESAQLADRAAAQLAPPPAGTAGTRAAPAGSSMKAASPTAETDAAASPSAGDASADAPPPAPSNSVEGASASVSADPPSRPDDSIAAETDPVLAHADFAGSVEAAPSAEDVSHLEAQLQQTLAEPAPAAPAAPAPAAETPEPAAAPEPAEKSSLLLKPLELLSAPLSSRPRLRETVGKIAIITAFNAIVVLIYVLLFRG